MGREKEVGMTPIERAARAICLTLGHDPDKDDEVGLGDPGDLNWNMFEDQVRAVLEAIREPSEVMAKAGTDALPAFEAPLRADASDCWQAMIDAALSE